MIIIGRDKPLLIVMSGVQGSGKSTIAEKMLKDLGQGQVRETKIVSSDLIRKELFGDDYIYSPKDNALVFETIDQRIRENKYSNIIYDATNLTIRERQRIYDELCDKYTIIVFQMVIGRKEALERLMIRNAIVKENDRIEPKVMLKSLSKLEPPIEQLDCHLAIIKYF